MTITGPFYTPTINTWASFKDTHVCQVVNTDNVNRGLESVNVKLKSFREIYEIAPLVNTTFTGSLSGWLNGVGAEYGTNTVNLNYNGGYVDNDYLQQAVYDYPIHKGTIFTITLTDAIVNAVGQDISIKISNLEETEILSVLHTLPIGTSTHADIVVGTTTTNWTGFILKLIPTADTSIYPIADITLDTIEVKNLQVLSNDVQLSVLAPDGYVYQADTVVTAQDISDDLSNGITVTFTFTPTVLIAAGSTMQLIFSITGYTGDWEDVTGGSLYYTAIGSKSPSAIYAEGYAKFLTVGTIDWTYDVPNGTPPYVQDDTDLWFEVFWSDALPLSTNPIDEIDWTCTCNLQTYQNSLNLAALQDCLELFGERTPVAIPVFQDAQPTTSQYKAWYEERGFDLPMSGLDKLLWANDSTSFGKQDFYVTQEDIVDRVDNTYWACHALAPSGIFQLATTETVPAGATFPASPLIITLELPRDVELIFQSNCLIMINFTGADIGSFEIRHGLDTFTIPMPIITANAFYCEVEINLGIISAGTQTFEVGFSIPNYTSTIVSTCKILWKGFYR